MSNSNFGSGSGSGAGGPLGSGSGTGVTTGTGNTGGFGNTGATGGTGFGTTGSGSTGSGSTGGGTDFSTPGGYNAQSGTDSGICPHCGQSTAKGGNLEQFLGRLGITEDMIGNLKGQFQNVDIDEYLNTARDFLKDGSSKASSYAKENPGKVAAGVAALALGAGLIYAAVNRDKA